MARRKKELVSISSGTEITKQPNSISRAIFYASATAYKIIVYALFKTSENGTGGYTQDFNLEVSFSVWEFAKHLGIEKSGTLIESVKKACVELIKSSITYDDNEKHKFYVYTFFSKIIFDEESNIITAKFNNDLMVFFQEKGYSALELLTVGNIQSFYALRYYAIAKSFSGNPDAYFVYTENELRELFDLKDEYKDRRNFVKRVIQEPIKELNDKTIYEFTAENKKISVGNYKWKFDVKVKESISKPLPIKKSETKKEKGEKKEYNASIEQMENLILKHKKQFDKLYEFELKQRDLFGKLPSETTARINAYLKLCKELGIEVK